jgi:UDP-N-acetylmuramoyl-tripeptide--D-alanyl-D-alanine ligase
VHLAQFNSVEEIAEAKAEIFDGLLAGGTAILNKDNPHFNRLAAKAKDFNVMSFGKNNAKILLQHIEIQQEYSLLQVKILDEILHVKLSLAGEHLALNCLAVLGAVKVLGQDLTLAAKALGELQGVKGRGERLTLPQNITLIDESYNANPASMRAAFKVLEKASGRKIAVLGDMLELGETALQEHAKLAEDLKAIDLVFTAGELMQALHEALPQDKRGGHALHAQALLPLVIKALRPQDTLMVKGSNGSKMFMLVEGLKKWEG